MSTDQPYHNDADMKTKKEMLKQDREASNGLSGSKIAVVSE
jgi:hypothetical protein